MIRGARNPVCGLVLSRKCDLACLTNGLLSVAFWAACRLINRIGGQDHTGDFMNRIHLSAVAVLFAAFSTSTYANCLGGSAIQTCTDNDGNSYQVNRFGNMTTVNGYNARTGSSWNETANTYGNQTVINGTAANGASWNESITNFGNGNRLINGTNSQGQSYSHYCTAYGCN